MHKHDPKTYSVLYFTPTGRQVESELASNYQLAVEAANGWKAEGKGTAVVTLCLYNNALPTPVLPEEEQ